MQANRDANSIHNSPPTLSRRNRLFLCISAIVIAATISASPCLGDSIQEQLSTGQTQDISLLSGDSGSSYENYLQKYGKASAPDLDLLIPSTSYIDSSGAELKKLATLDGENDILEWDNQEGWVSWSFEIQEAGLYHIGVKYYPVEGKGGDIEFELGIDGKMPFDEAQKLSFSRVWKDASDVIRDNRGNDLRPQQVESPMWQEESFRDKDGLYNDAYSFYLEKGVHTLRLTSIREPVAIKYLKIYNNKKIPAYAEVSKNYEAADYKSTSGVQLKFQAEKAFLKSSPVLHAISDRSGPATEPYDTSKIRLNTIGGENWEYPGQWIQWKFDVPEDGLYKIAARYRQNSVRGFFTTRKVYIDEGMPFSELDNVKFNYGAKWNMKVLGDDEPYLFYLTKGTHVLTMEAALGDMSETLRTVQDAVYTMNYIYRKIIMITGTSPDLYRDYYLEKEIPDLVPKLKDVKKTLDEEEKRLEKLTGHKGSEAVLLQQISAQLASMAEKPETIPERLGNFKDNASTLGAWILNIKQQPLELDYFVVASPDRRLPDANAGIAKSIVYEISTFFASFFQNYNDIGNVYNNKKSIEVWVALGRDQAQIVKSMIDDMFTPQTGLTVNLSLVQGSLMQATLAGKGPDVALNNGRGDPVNMAARGAVVPLDRFDGFKEVESRFMPTAMLPYEYNGHCYALPETQTFHMLFYRKDIFRELGIDPPDTWDDLYRIIPVIQRHNMEVGLPYTTIDAYGLIGSGMGAQNIFPTLLYQQGGEIYNRKATGTNLFDTKSIAAFEEWAGFYTRYSLPLTYDFYNRFRTGEMPIGIQNYTLYNMLSVGAPEIANLWDMIPIPGTVDKDGEIDRTEAASGTSCMIMSNARNSEAAWEFLKWWTGAEAQARYGNEQEAVMGPTARYNPANLEAFEKLSWSKKEQENLLKQWGQVREIPEVPGGYYTARNIDNAFRSAVLNSENPREALYYWNKQTNIEIERKRIEFGLDK